MDDKKLVRYIKGQLKSAHEFLEGAMKDVTDAHMDYHPEGTALPVGAQYAHTILSEDYLVHGMLKGESPLSAGEWSDKTGLSALMPAWDADWEKNNREWARSVQIDLPKLREYAQAVYAATDTYLNSQTDTTLMEEIDMSSMGMGKVSRAWFLGRIVIGHCDNLTGEIAAIKGVQGAKGYPF